MSGSIARRTIAAAAACTAAVAMAGGAATAASASTPSAAGDGPQLCKDLDVNVTATKAPDSPSGHHAVILHYTAADADTHCTLSGAPYDMTFYNNAGVPLDVRSEITEGGKPERVTIDAQHSASSAVLIPNGPNSGPESVATLGLHLPSDASNTQVGTDWPDSDLSGTPQFTNITQD